MTAFQPKDPAFESRVRESFTRQRVMALIGAVLTRVEPGRVEIELPFRDDLTQQHGFFHAGVVGTIADTAGGYAAYTLMPADASILSVEFKVNLLAPARGQRFLARGRVLRAGRRITVCELEVTAFDAGQAKLCLFGLQTVMCVRDSLGGAPPG